MAAIENLFNNDHTPFFDGAMVSAARRMLNNQIYGQIIVIHIALDSSQWCVEASLSPFAIILFFGGALESGIILLSNLRLLICNI